MGQSLWIRGQPCPLGLNAFPLLPYWQPAQYPLSAYVYAVLGVPPTQTGTIEPVLLYIYSRAFNSDCGYGSTGVTVNATVYAAAPPDYRHSPGRGTAFIGLEETRRREVRGRSTRSSGATKLTCPTGFLNWQI